MGRQWNDAGPSVLEELDGQQVGVETAQPGPDNAGNNEEVANKGGAFTFCKYSGSQFASAKAFFSTFLILLLLEAQFSVSSKLRSYLAKPQLPLDDASMQKYFDDFTKSANVMQQAWEQSKSPVRQAFQKYFTPSLEDGLEPREDPLAIINGHVAEMQNCKVLSDSSAEVRRDLAQHLLFLRGICRTVTLRLQELQWFVYMNEEFDVPVPVPGHDEPYSYPDLESLEEGTQDGLSATHFLKSVGFFGGDCTQKVDEMLTDKLIFLFTVENKQNLYNLVARYYFERLFQPFGEDRAFSDVRFDATYHIPHTGKPVQIGALAKAAELMFQESESTSIYANIRKMHRIADNWTPKEVLEATKQQEEENANNFQMRLTHRREQMRSLLDKGVPRDSLVITALFLL
ncbi:hypothetical protein EBH_0072460 [Eimeria brunetti]|uniref:Uncharacterized protein n=1 Tax=Eimeria brunetti TaxID=51314 RepID=U6LHV2_9EIME|nr:hypothetical protein EBH_0072460 [Eimeria brunetti]